MRWPSKFINSETPPGTTRVKRVFAWRPKRIDDTIVWLEYFEILQAFTIFEWNIIIDGKAKGAKVGRWEDISVRMRG